MSEPNEPQAPSASDARRAAFRTRDALRAAVSRAGLPAGAAGVEVHLAEPEVALPVAGLLRAIAEAARVGSACLVPGGGWSGAAFPVAETYVASWELDLLDLRRAAAGTAETAPARAAAPVLVRGRSGSSAALSFSPWLVHSFAGRKGHARPDVLALVPASARAVLDVGCGEGALGAALEARGARVTGVELDAAAAEAASRRLTRVLAMPAEEAASAVPARPDTVVLADVLEHLRDPRGVLRALRAAIAPGGVLVFSLPNATHAAVLGGALRGRWDRELEGVVADDHRTYAGRSGWAALLSECGFRVTSLRPAAARTPLSGEDRAALLAATKLTPDDLDAVQWLGTAEPATPSGSAAERPEGDDGGLLGGEDPVGGVSGRAVERDLVLSVRNPVQSGLVDALLRGALLSGTDAAALVSGWTSGGLARRFEGSGLSVGVEASALAPLTPDVRAALAAYRSAGLPADDEALGVAERSVRFRRAR
jgi:trans-aconitate methyltransferase